MYRFLLVFVCLVSFSFSQNVVAADNNGAAEQEEVNLEIKESPFTNVDYVLFGFLDEEVRKYDKPIAMSEKLDVWFLGVIKDKYSDESTPIAVEWGKIKFKVKSKIKGTFVSYKKKYPTDNHPEELILFVPSEEIKRIYEVKARGYYNHYKNSFIEARAQYLEDLKQNEERVKKEKENREKAKKGELIVTP